MLHNGCYYQSPLGLKLIHASKRGPWAPFQYKNAIFLGIGIPVIKIGRPYILMGIPKLR